MSRCPEPGLWRAFLDNELPSAERMALATHQEACRDCQAVLTRLRQTADLVYQQALPALPAPTPAVTRLAWQRLQGRLAERPSPRPWHERIGAMMRTLSTGSGRLALSGALTSLVIVVMLAATPVGSYALQALSVFRVQTFKAVTFEIDQSALPTPKQAVGGSTAPRTGMVPAQPTDPTQALEELKRELAEVGVTLETTVSEQVVREAKNLAEARDAGKDASVKEIGSLPADLQGTLPKIMVADPTITSFDVDMAALRQAASAAGKEAPAALPGISSTATTLSATVKTAFAVVQVYGEGDQAVVLAQGASPELTFSEGIDVLALRDAVLAMPGISKTTRTQVLSIRDNEWSHTLIIPVPRGTIVKDVAVGGALGTPVGATPGLLIVDPKTSRGVVLWEGNGTLYALTGPYPEAVLLQMANSLR